MTTSAILLALLLAVQDPLDERLRGLLDLLRADDIETREKATKDLVALGVEALPRLEKILESATDGEVGSRVKSVVEKLRREAKVLRMAPPIRLVSISAKDRPLKAFLEEAGRQAGVECVCVDAVADRPVTLEAKGEPLLKVLDRACLARGDVTFDIAEGKVRVAAGTHRNSPTAYVGAFRARLKRVAVYESNDFGDRRTDLVLYLHVDAQPDQKCCSVCATSAPPGGGPAGGGLPFKAASESPLATWMSERSGRTVLLIDEVPVILEEGDRIDGIYVLKGAPAGLKVLPSLRLRALYRFAVGSVSTRVPLVTGKLSTESGGLPFYIQNSGRHVFITSLQRVGREPSRPLEELVELDSFVVLDKEGKEISLTNQTVAPPGFRPQFRYQLVADGDLKGEGLTIRFNLIDAVERDVEFELKDVKLRD